MSTAAARKPVQKMKAPKGLSKRITWLRDYYFKGVKRAWNNEFTAWSTGTPWDRQYQELTYYIVPEVYPLLDTLDGSFMQAARTVALHADFWKWSLPERRAWFVKEIMVNYLPREVLPGDLIAGARFNIVTSLCFNRKEARAYERLIHGRKGARAQAIWFHNHGYGNAGATSGHIVAGYEQALRLGFRGISEEIESAYDALNDKERSGPKGDQLSAMRTAAGMPKELAAAYAEQIREMAAQEQEARRRLELEEMAANLEKVPWKPPGNFWEAIQALWLIHMLIMSDENYPGPGVSFGRIDQYLLPYWERSKAKGMDREFAKEILKCFWFHCNTAYDAMIQNGHQGITAGFGQLLTLSGMGPKGADMTNELTYMILEVIDEMSPILEPKPNVRLHRGTPEPLLDKIVDMVTVSQGSPFLLNFDERSMAGMLRQSEKGGLQHLINLENVHEYAPVGCLENTMVGNDRSGTVDNNLNLLKAVELALTGGKDLIPFRDPMTGKTEKIRQDGPRTGASQNFASFDDFWEAYAEQTAYIIAKCVGVHENSESVRARYFPTPYLSCLVKGCAQKGLDVTRAGAEINFTTLEAVTFATTVDSLLAIRYLVFDEKICSMAELITALQDNWRRQAVLQAIARIKAPKFGRDDDQADALAGRVMDLWTAETWKHRTRTTNRQYRPGMLSWNYWAGDGFIMAASADGREKGQFLSNAICPSNGADIHGPTANTNSVGRALGGKAADGQGDFLEFFNALPNGASHTITFNPSIVQDPEHKQKFKAFLKGYVENGGTALQINILDPETLRDAQKQPRDYRHLLVRITGYNAYFTTIGKELQNEVIHRINHSRF